MATQIIFCPCLMHYKPCNITSPTLLENSQMATYVTSSSSSSGIGLIGLVYAGIILGKIFGLVDWSWFYILMPFNIILGILILCAVIYAIAYLADRHKARKR